MSRLFVWKSGKKRKVHVLNPESRKTWCKAENAGGRAFDGCDSDPPKEREICGICLHLEGKALKRSARKKRVKSKKTNGPRDPFLASWEWRQVRYMALKASNGKCQCCGRGQAEGVVLCVDHIQSRRKRPDLALDIKNLQVLCNDCNMGKGSWDSTDWREPRLSVVLGERA